MTRRALVSTFCGLALILLGGAYASASTVTLEGSVWAGVYAGDAELSAVPGAAPDVTFDLTTSTGISMSSSLGYSLLDFLDSSSPAVSDVVGTPAVLAAPMSTGWGPGDLFTFVGTINLPTGEVFSVEHDDGASFYVNGTLLPGSFPGITGAVLDNVTYTGPSLTGATMEIVYGETAGPPALLFTNLPTGGISPPTPEPASLLLMGSGLLGIAGAIRRRFAG